MTANNDEARVILAVTAEADDAWIWSQLRDLQADMFATAGGALSVKFAFFGAEGSLQTRPCITTRWATDPDDLAGLMDKGRTQCRCGCYADIDDILVAALREARQAPVQAVVILGDVFHGDLSTAIAHAEELRAAGTRLFLFQQNSRGRLRTEAQEAFLDLAEQTGGAYFELNPAVERLAGRLPGLFEAVTHFAIGGPSALRALGNEPACQLLEQMRKQGG